MDFDAHARTLGRTMPPPFEDCTLSDGKGIYKTTPKLHFRPCVAFEAALSLAFAAVRDMMDIDPLFTGLLVFVLADWNAENTPELVLAERCALEEVARCASVEELLVAARKHSAGHSTS